MNVCFVQYNTVTIKTTLIDISLEIKIKVKNPILGGFHKTEADVKNPTGLCILVNN